MKKLILLTVADSWHHFEKPISEYEKRLQKELEIVLLKPHKSGETGIIRKLDTHDVIIQLEKYSDSFVVFCDVLGKSLGDTKAMSVWLSQKMQQHKSVVFVIGGAYGLDMSLMKPHVDNILSFTDWTLPHGLAVLMLIEQLYRTTNLLAGGKYHHE
ncbi:23S rRNA (pseudouridine(1915)-N(3))-methyltransferase RlmH [Candidatus Gracilibacteria bacterium]|nr:23S rRNA (pseudouridine(1915)-N(3))-methyltransferase RlmH [Candidatus Gracilibacteria bacterium]